MPVTKTAKRALRSSKKKESVNKVIVSKLEAAIRLATKSKNAQKLVKAISLTDKASKNKVIHKNKAARIKSRLSKFLPKGKSSTKSSSKK